MTRILNSASALQPLAGGQKSHHCRGRGGTHRSGHSTSVEMATFKDRVPYSAIIDRPRSGDPTRLTSPKPRCSKTSRPRFCTGRVNFDPARPPPSTSGQRLKAKAPGEATVSPFRVCTGFRALFAVRTRSWQLRSTVSSIPKLIVVNACRLVFGY